MQRAETKITFSMFIHRADANRFGLFRMVNGLPTHIMDAKGLWIVLPDDEQEANTLIHAMMDGERHGLPQFNQEDSENNEETNDHSEPDHTEAGTELPE